MSNKKEWKGTEPISRSAKQRRIKQELDDMSPEERKATSRRQFVNFLNMFQGSESLVSINGKTTAHSPMSQEEADLHLAIFDGDVKQTSEVKATLAQLEAIRWPENKKLQAKMWQAMENAKDEE